jgi:molecular chaperone HtpG
MSESQDSTKVLSQELFDEALKGVPLLVVEKENRRTTMAVSDLSGEKEFWTIDCALFSFAEQLIREAATSVAVGQIISALEVPDAEYPEALIVCGADPNDTIGRYAFGGREVDRIYLHRSQRRLDLAG